MNKKARIASLEDRISSLEATLQVKVGSLKSKTAHIKRRGDTTTITFTADLGKTLTFRTSPPYTAALNSDIKSFAQDAFHSMDWWAVGPMPQLKTRGAVLMWEKGTLMLVKDIWWKDDFGGPEVDDDEDGSGVAFSLHRLMEGIKKAGWKVGRVSY